MTKSAEAAANILRLICAIVLALDRPDFLRFMLEWINVHHPAKNLRIEFAAGSVAIFLRRY